MGTTSNLDFLMPITIKVTPGPTKEYTISEIKVGSYFGICGSLYYKLSESIFISFKEDIFLHFVSESRKDVCAVPIDSSEVDIQITCPSLYNF